LVFADEAPAASTSATRPASAAFSPKPLMTFDAMSAARPRSKAPAAARSSVAGSAAAASCRGEAGHRQEAEAFGRLLRAEHRRRAHAAGDAGQQLHLLGRRPRDGPDVGHGLFEAGDRPDDLTGAEHRRQRAGRRHRRRTNRCQGLLHPPRGLLDRPGIPVHRRVQPRRLRHDVDHQVADVGQEGRSKRKGPLDGGPSSC
jgi:hypothetical protein